MASKPSLPVAGALKTPWRSLFTGPTRRLEPIHATARCRDSEVPTARCPSKKCLALLSRHSSFAAFQEVPGTPVPHSCPALLSRTPVPPHSSPAASEVPASEVPTARCQASLCFSGPGRAIEKCQASLWRAPNDGRSASSEGEAHRVSGFQANPELLIRSASRCSGVWSARPGTDGRPRRLSSPGARTAPDPPSWRVVGARDMSRKASPGRELGNCRLDDRQPRREAVRRKDRPTIPRLQSLRRPAIGRHGLTIALHQRLAGRLRDRMETRRR